jgi:hypothetical protein
MKKLLSYVIFILLIMTFRVICADICSEKTIKETESATLRGKDFVELGDFGTRTGKLKSEKGEWFLEVADRIYEIHLGDHTHRKNIGIQLNEGKEVTVTGFIYRQANSKMIDIAVCTILDSEKEYRFREDDGTPLWRGSGRNKHSN